MLLPLSSMHQKLIGARFNGLELLCTIFLTFKRVSLYFYCLVVATLGVLAFITTKFVIVFAKGLLPYGIGASIALSWSAMVSDPNHIERICSIY
jgi:hypothetical protein